MSVIPDGLLTDYKQVETIMLSVACDYLRGGRGTMFEVRKALIIFS